VCGALADPGRLGGRARRPAPTLDPTDQQLAALDAEPGVTVQLHPVTSLELVASTPTNLQGGPHEQHPQELHLGRTFGPSGIFEQDDMENWEDCTLVNSGKIAQRYDLHHGIAVVAGITIGVAWRATGWWRRRSVRCWRRSIPCRAPYPVFILVLGFGAGSKIALVALECAYPIAYNTFAGVQGIPRRYFRAARNFEAGRGATLRMSMRAQRAHR
jgi:hypothetical protein